MEFKKKNYITFIFRKGRNTIKEMFQSFNDFMLAVGIWNDISLSQFQMVIVYRKTDFKRGC